VEWTPQPLPRVPGDGTFRNLGRYPQVPPRSMPLPEAVRLLRPLPAAAGRTVAGVAAAEVTVGSVLMLAGAAVLILAVAGGVVYFATRTEEEFQFPGDPMLGPWPPVVDPDPPPGAQLPGAAGVDAPERAMIDPGVHPDERIREPDPVAEPLRLAGPLLPVISQPVVTDIDADEDEVRVTVETPEGVAFAIAHLEVDDDEGVDFLEVDVLDLGLESELAAAVVRQDNRSVPLTEHLLTTVLASLHTRPDFVRIGPGVIGGALEVLTRLIADRNLDEASFDPQVEFGTGEEDAKEAAELLRLIDNQGRPDEIDPRAWSQLLDGVRGVLTELAPTSHLARFALRLLAGVEVLPMDEKTVTAALGPKVWQKMTQEPYVQGEYHLRSKLFFLDPRVTDPKVAAGIVLHEAEHGTQPARGLLAWKMTGKSSRLRMEFGPHVSQRDHVRRAGGDPGLPVDNAVLAHGIERIYGKSARDYLATVLTAITSVPGRTPQNLRPFDALAAHHAGMPPAEIAARDKEAALLRRWRYAVEYAESWSTDGFDANAEAAANAKDLDRYLADLEATGALPRPAIEPPVDREAMRSWTIDGWPVTVTLDGYAYDHDEVRASTLVDGELAKLSALYAKEESTLWIWSLRTPGTLDPVRVEQLRQALTEAARRVAAEFGSVDVIEDALDR